MRLSQSTKTLDPRKFNAMKHVAPKYNILGNQVNSTKQLKGCRLDTISGEQKMPAGWSKPGTLTTGKTMNDLKETRYRESIPDPTFDVDGDGQVSQRDYFLAKHFDKDKDGKLNT